MNGPRPGRILGVVVVHDPDRPVTELPAVRDLAGQVDELLVVGNGCPQAGSETQLTGMGARWVAFPNNRGTAAAWNFALRSAAASSFQYLYLLDQDSLPALDAVSSALIAAGSGAFAALVQPAHADFLRLDPFPWNTVASGSLLDVGVIESLGGFDESLFVDEVDHELFARAMRAGYDVRSVPTPTIDHQTGSPRRIPFLTRGAVVSGHGAARRRLQGYSAGVLIRRYSREAPATAARLLFRHGLTAAKDVAGGEAPAARALFSGLLAGTTAGRPPAQAAEVACPYCSGPLVGRFGAVPDWIFGAGGKSDVYWCPACGALAAGRVPAADELASWYDDYYTHDTTPQRIRLWSRLWPTPTRRREMDDQRRYLSAPGVTGRLLEVGTGSGERLVEFAERGWDVVGQDLDPGAGRVARERGLVVHGCPVEELIGHEMQFDLIGLNHVLEHTADPAGLLAACKALLAPAGQICVISPNAQGLGRLVFGRWWFGLDQPRHLAIPTLASLEQLRTRVGLDEVTARCSAANAAVVLGGSLARVVEEPLPPGPLRRGAGFAAHLVGQALGRVAIMLGSRLGEEVVWVGRRSSA